MKLKRFFVISYYVCFRSKNGMHDSLEEFFIWNAPSFCDWICSKKQKRIAELSTEIVVQSCYKS